jgi:hypothetical protein
VLQQKAAVFAIQLPQGVHGVFKAASDGIQVVWLLGWQSFT